MKKILLLLLLNIAFYYAHAQNFTVIPVNKSVNCCAISGAYDENTKKEVDLNNDLEDDFSFSSNVTLALPPDMGFYAEAWQGTFEQNYRISNVVMENDSFSGTYSTYCLLSAILLDQDWAQTGGIRYLGVKRNQRNDTYYGWMKLEYIKEDVLPTDDSMKIIEVAFNPNSNQTVFAGQLYATPFPDVQVYPNPAAEQQTLIINNTLDADLTVELIDMSGRKVMMVYKGYCNISRMTLHPNLKTLARGVYQYKISIGNITKYVKINKH